MVDWKRCVLLLPFLEVGGKLVSVGLLKPTARLYPGVTQSTQGLSTIESLQEYTKRPSQKQRNYSRVQKYNYERIWRYKQQNKTDPEQKELVSSFPSCAT